MADHYYSSQPTSTHAYHDFAVTVRGVSLALRSDAGVFSKNRLDTGSELLIEALPLRPELRTVLDLGCGYGPIGLTVAKLLPEATVYLSDINERAVELATYNAKMNNLTNVVFKAGEGFVPFPDQHFDLVATNPPIRAGKQVVYAMVDQAAEHLNPGGQYVAVILTRQGAKSLEKKLVEVFGNVRELEKGSGYRVIASTKEAPG